MTFYEAIMRGSKVENAENIGGGEMILYKHSGVQTYLELLDIFQENCWFELLFTIYAPAHDTIKCMDIQEEGERSIKVQLIYGAH